MHVVDEEWLLTGGHSPGILQSLFLISKTLEQTKKKFKESGHTYIFWGSLIFVVALIQYYLLWSDSNNGSGFPALLYPLGGIYTFIYFRSFHQVQTTYYWWYCHQFDWLRRLYYRLALPFFASRSSISHRIYYTGNFAEPEE